MTTVHKFPEYELVSKKCQILLQEKEIKFAGFIDKMGNLIVGGFKENSPSLEDEYERRKICMDLALRTSMRTDYDHSLGPVLYTTSRRKNAVMMSFPLQNCVLLISAKKNTKTEILARKIMKIIHME